MDVNYSRCFHCGKQIHYSESRLLPDGGGVCLVCAKQHGYTVCEECQDYFIPESEEYLCEVCLRRIFERI
ncbi:hypothetical protein BH10ACI1_BH10ACI1_15940 [soil metagenome]